MMRIEAWSGARWSAAARPVALVASLALGVGVLSGVARASAFASSAVPGTIQTVAGGVGGPGPATGIYIGSPCAVSFMAGHLFAGQGIIRAISIRTDMLSTPAGAESLGGPGPGRGPAAAAGLSRACRLTARHPRNLLTSPRAA